MLQQLINGLQEGAFYSLIALAVVVVMKTTDVPNFAMADMGLICAYVAWSANAKKGVPIGLAIVLALVFAFVFGAIVQRFVVYPAASGVAAVAGILLGFTPLNFAWSAVGGTFVGLAFTFYAERRGFRSLAGGSHFPLLLSTIGVGVILVNSMQPIWGVESHNFDPLWTGKPFRLGSAIVTRTQVLTFAVGLILALALAAFFKSPWGVRMRAIAENRAVASVLGVSPSRVSMLAWGIATVLAAVVMILHTQFNTLTPGNGEAIIFAGFVAAVIGGFSSLTGAFIGGLMLGAFRGLTAYFLAVSWQEAIPLLAVVVVLLLRPQGIASSTRVREV